MNSALALPVELEARRPGQSFDHVLVEADPLGLGERLQVCMKLWLHPESHLPGRAFRAIPALAVLVEHVSRVMGCIAKKKMLWVDTGGVIATVENPCSWGDSAVEKFPSDTMCAEDLVLVPDSPVARIGKTAGPEPAPILRFIDLGKKTILQRLTGRHLCYASKANINRGGAATNSPPPATGGVS